MCIYNVIYVTIAKSFGVSTVCAVMVIPAWKVWRLGYFLTEMDTQNFTMTVTWRHERLWNGRWRENIVDKNTKCPRGHTMYHLKVQGLLPFVFLCAAKVIDHSKNLCESE